MQIDTFKIVDRLWDIWDNHGACFIKDIDMIENMLGVLCALNVINSETTGLI